MVSFYISRTDKAAIEALAVEKEQTQADTYRDLLHLGLDASAPAWPPLGPLHTSVPLSAFSATGVCSLCGGRHATR
jgi:hypothetical protein